MRILRLETNVCLLCTVFILFLSSGVHAFKLDIIDDPLLLLNKDALYGIGLSDLAAEAAMYNLDIVKREAVTDSAFRLDLVTGEVFFGDGLRGEVPPSGRDGTAAVYRYGEGSGGNTVLDPFVISPENFPILIPIDDPSTDETETKISFFLSSIASITFEVADQGIWVNAIKPIPEPTTLMLVGLGLVGLAFFRRRFKLTKTYHN